MGLLTLSFFVVFSLFQNCSKYNANQKDGERLSIIRCKAQPQVSSPFEENKVQINESFLGGKENTLSSSSGNKGSGVQQKMTISETELGLLVDPLCLAQENRPIEILGQIIEVPSELSHLNRAAISLTVHGEIDMEQLTADMEQSHCLIGISENQMVTLEDTPSPSPAFNDPLARNQGHLKFIDYLASIDLQRQITASVVVAVVDSGIESNHPDFQGGQLWSDGQGNHGRSFALNTNPEDIQDNTSHGTHVAGLIAARQNNVVGTVGLTHDFVQIMTVKVFNGMEAPTSNISNGIRYAIQNGAHIINLSLSTEKENAMLNDVVTEAVNAGIVVVMAASNNSREISSSSCPSPACIGHLLNGGLTVGSVDTKTGNLSDFSSFSSEFVEIAAPGSELGLQKGLLSTIIGGDWSRKPGTSMAAPVVTAAAAFLIGYLKTNNKPYRPASVEAFLKDKGSSQNHSQLQSLIEGGRIINFGLISTNLGYPYNYNQYCL